MVEPAKHARRVVLYGNPVLRTKSRLISEITPDIARLLEALKETVVAAEGLGLAANQVGVPVAACALNPRGDDIDRAPYCLLNPRVVVAEGKVEAEEGCLSLPHLYDFLPRPEMVRVSGMNESGEEVTVEATGMMARALLHEIDHLSGVLFIDHLSESRRRMLATRLKELEAEETRHCG
jgi:peptide deformylase